MPSAKAKTADKPSHPVLAVLLGLLVAALMLTSSYVLYTGVTLPLVDQAEQKIREAVHGIDLDTTHRSERTPTDAS